MKTSLSSASILNKLSNDSTESSQKPEAVDNSSSEALRPATSSRDPEILISTQTDCIQKDKNGPRDLFAGRRGANDQQTLYSSEYFKPHSRDLSLGSLKPEDYFSKHVKPLNLTIPSVFLASSVSPGALSIEIPASTPHSDTSMQSLSSRTSQFSFRRSPVSLPKKYERFFTPFSKKLNMGEYLGRESMWNKSIDRDKYDQISKMAALRCTGNALSFKSSPEARERTLRAINDFFILSYQLLSTDLELKYPLENRNKCIGIVAVPTNRLVMIAISQDKDPSKDSALRANLVRFLEKLNLLEGNRWTFELVRVPTKAQYLMPRTLLMRTSHKAPQETVNPHTRCVEVAMMAALNKVGRHIKFDPSDIAVLALGSSVWSSQIVDKGVSVFGPTVERNKKHAMETPIRIMLAEGVEAELDEWNPCKEHCAIYANMMTAIACSGGYSSSFMEPRSEFCEFIKRG